MATPIKQIQTSDEVLHDIQSVEYIVGTQTAATNMWKGISGSAELYAGKIINYKLPYAGSTNTNTHTGLTTNTTLELTLANGSTVVYPVYRNASTAITTHYPANSIVRLVFDPTSVTLNGHTFEGSWKTADYDSNTNTYVTQSNTTTNNFFPFIIKAATATATVTTTVRFNSKLTGNPSTGAIKLNTTSITPTASSAITLQLPATGGTLALTSDIPSSLPPTAHTHAWGDITNPPTSYTPTAHTHTIGQVYNGSSALSVNSSSSNIQMDGTASAGSGSALALANHVHPTDTSRAPLASPAFTGYPTLANTPTTTMGVANKGYVDSALGGITQVDYTVTTTLPTTGVKGTIYLVGHTHSASQNDYYDEYIYANNAWEKIGHTDIDLTDYATKTFVTTTLINDGIKVIDLGEQTIPINIGMGQLTISSDVSSEIDADFQNKNLALRIHHTEDVDIPEAHVIVFNIGNIEYNNMNFHGFQGSFTLSNLQIYECFVGIGFGASAGVNLIGIIKQSTARSASITNGSSDYYGVSHMSSGIADLYDGTEMYYPITQFDSVLVYDVGNIPITQTELTNLSNGISVSKTISLPEDVWSNIKSLHYNPGVALTSHITLNGVELSRYSLLNEGDLTNGGKQFSGVVAINGSSMIFTLLTVHPSDHTQNTLILKPIPSISDIPTVPTNVSTFNNDAGYITSSDIPTNVGSFNNDVGYITISDVPVVSAAASLTTGVTVGSIDINGTTTTFYAPNPTSVTATRAFSSGTALGTITIDGTSTTLNIPNASSSTAGITKVGASGGAAAFSHTHAASDIDLSDYIEIIDIGTLNLLNENFALQVFLTGESYSAITISNELRTEILNKFHNNACGVKGNVMGMPFLYLNETTHDYNSAYEYKSFSGTFVMSLNNVLHYYTGSINISNNTEAEDFFTVMALANAYDVEGKIGYNDLTITPTLQSGTEIGTIVALQNGTSVISATLYAPTIPSNVSEFNNDAGYITGIDWPSDYTPSIHDHNWSDITNPPASYTPSAHTHTLGNIYNGNTALSTTTIAGVFGSTTASKATAGTTVELYQASVSNDILNLTAYNFTPYTFTDITVPKATTAITVVKV